MNPGDRPNIFGTDGVRDRAGAGFLAPESLRHLGIAIAHFAAQFAARSAGQSAARSARNGPVRFLCGRDTRASGPSIEAQLAGALVAGGCEVESAGVLPTPAISLLTVEEKFDFGVVISASHNPPEFNGVKLFDGAGRKLTPEAEETISRIYHESRAARAPDAGRVSEITQHAPVYRPLFRERYRASLLLNALGKSALPGMKIVLDCAYGATASIAPAVFGGTGGFVIPLHATEDGSRINVNCGSTAPAELARAVLANRAALGIAFDGDGDRAIFVDENGAVVDGDEVIAMLAVDMLAAGQLPKNGVVVTVMTNAGMLRFLRERGIQAACVPVGDREVAAELARTGYALGGEQSGHIIFAGEAATGDGIRTGLHLAKLMQRAGKPLSKLRSDIPRFPQTLLSIDVAKKPPLAEIKRYVSAHAEAERALGGRGRILVRYSGTEPLVRVLVEGPDPGENQRLAQSMAQALAVEIGVSAS